MCAQCTDSVSCLKKSSSISQHRKLGFWDRGAGSVSKVFATQSSESELAPRIPALWKQSQASQPVNQSVRDPVSKIKKIEEDLQHGPWLPHPNTHAATYMLSVMPIPFLPYQERRPEFSQAVPVLSDTKLDFSHLVSYCHT